MGLLCSLNCCNFVMLWCFHVGIVLQWHLIMHKNWLGCGMSCGIRCELYGGITFLMSFKYISCASVGGLLSVPSYLLKISVASSIVMAPSREMFMLVARARWFPDTGCWLLWSALNCRMSVVVC